MSAPSKAYAIQLVKIQPVERLATTSELNFAPSSVTNCREAKGMGYWAATQVKGLSSEISYHVGGRYCSLSRRQNSHNCYWRGYASPTESETVARYQKDSMGTRETQSVFHNGVCDNKPMNGELFQKALWESDQLIVVMKRGNARGAKGLAGRLLEQGHIFQIQDWSKDDNETVFKTYEREVFLKSRVRENLKHGSVRGLIVSPDENNNFRRRWL